MKEYKLEKTTLIVHQGMNNEGVDISSIRAMVMEDFYKNSEQRLLEQQKKKHYWRVVCRLIRGMMNCANN